MAINSRVEFFSVASQEELAIRYPSADVKGWGGLLNYPLTVVELWETAAGTNIEFGPHFSRLPRNNFIRDSFSMACGTHIHLDASPEDVARLFPGNGEEC
jgi:hypothetical protein